jgi:hypothetical protein
VLFNLKQGLNQDNYQGYKKRPDMKTIDSELIAEKKAQQAKALAQVVIRSRANTAAFISEYDNSYS